MDFGSGFSINWVSSVLIIPTVGKDGKPGPEIYYIPGKVTLPLFITAFAAAFGSSFPHGYNSGVLNAPQHLIRDFLNQSIYDHYGTVNTETSLNLVWSLTVAIYLVGGMVGAFTAGFYADKFGRRNALLICHIYQFVAAILFGCCRVANSLEMMIIGRIIVGYGCGAGTALVPLYMTEMAPVNIRGAMGVVHQVAMTIGILVSQLFGLDQIMGNENSWHYLLAFTAVPSFISMFILPFFPDSPRYLLVNQGKEEEARKALRRIRGPDHNIDQDIEEMINEKRQQELAPKWNMAKLFKEKRLRWPLILVASVSLAQQLSGINVTFFYSTEIFHKAGIALEYTQYATLGTGLVNVIMTFVSLPLMESSGRRPLLLGGLIGMLISMIVMTVALNLQGMVPWMAYISVVCMISYVICFAIGLGPIPQFIGAELFKQGPRPAAMSFAGFINWLANFIVGISFPSIQLGLGAYSFTLFMCCVTFFFFLLYKKLPETKGKSYDEIEKIFHMMDDESKGEDELTKAKVGVRLATYTDEPGFDHGEKFALIRGHRPSMIPGAANGLLFPGAGPRRLSVFSPDTRPEDEILDDNVLVEEDEEDYEDEEEEINL
ncbi:solute carrier family 2, facilitated glucose transporter member 1-like [Lineus longissimus]|uniref:solute carrier family 2, facilitated glucose transporter member 1-like n=1 Tax=Lineus longissimus TaxID=88925 RepID=UPI002B4F3ABC